LNTNTAILVNYSSNNSNGEKKWLLVKDRVMELLPLDTKVISYSKGFDIDECIRSLITEENISSIISAGGDGSINYILNAIVACEGESTTRISLGAIGLGSSNDFTKPCSNFISGIPVKIKMQTSKPADICKVIFNDKSSTRQVRYSIINASLGVTAEANLLFNQGDFFINRFKSRFTGITILYTAVKTIMRYKNKHVHLSYDAVEKDIDFTNISIVKNANISGSFKYDQKIEMDDGFLGLNYFYDMGKVGLLRTLYDLSRGKFSGKPNRVSVLTKGIKISSDEHLVLETDGEIQYANDVEFSIIPRAIRVMG
jgi:diacylglycerol kinase family enzyme